MPSALAQHEKSSDSIFEQLSLTGKSAKSFSRMHCGLALARIS